MQTLYVTVKLTVKDEAELPEVVEQLEYSFEHEYIVDSEIASFSHN